MKAFFRERLTAVLFLGLLLVLGLLTVFLPKAEISVSERRRLAKWPKLTAETLWNGKFGEGLSDYAVDHFALREGFRAANTLLRTGLLRQQSVEGVFEEDGCLFLAPGTLDEKAVTLAGEKIQSVIDAYFPDLDDVYFSVIPDKTEFARGGPPHLTATETVSCLNETVRAKYIDILPTLSLEDYYRTDTHWRQECIFDTAAALVDGMGGSLSDPGFTFREIRPFSGVLAGRYAAPLPAESLFYGENDATRNAKVKNLERPEITTVYEPETTSPDPYDVFLSGASAYIEIENPSARTNRHLVLFRDSFGSSIAHYLLTEYEKLSIIDMRYIFSTEIGTVLDAETADDVLFLYSAPLLNTGSVFR